METEPQVFCSHTEMRDPASLVEHPRNYNTHPAEQIRLLAKIIKHQGWRNPITVSKRSGYVVKGHGRLAAALQLGCSEVPVDVQEYKDEASEYADMIADNRIAELSEIDEDAIKELLLDDIFEGFDLDLTGFDTRSLVDDDIEEIDTSDVNLMENFNIQCASINDMMEIKNLLGATTAKITFDQFKAKWDEHCNM